MGSTWIDGDLHAPRSIVPSFYHFTQEIETPFLNAVEEALGPKHYTPHLARLYKKTIKYILTLLSVGFQEARAEMTQVEMTNNMAASVISLHSGTMQSTTAGLATPDNAGGRK